MCSTPFQISERGHFVSPPTTSLHDWFRDTWTASLLHWFYCWNRMLPLFTDFYKYLDESWKLFINASLASASRVFYFLLLVLNAFNVLLVNLSQNSNSVINFDPSLLASPRAFPDPVGHFRGPWRPFWIFEALLEGMIKSKILFNEIDRRVQ